jgi:hypothetical protein
VKILKKVVKWSVLAMFGLLFAIPIILIGVLAIIVLGAAMVIDAVIGW